MLQAGTSTKKITPPMGVDLTGYAGRPSPASCVKDDLYAKALVISNGNQTLCLLSLDLLGLNASQVGQIRKIVNDRCGIPANSIMVACSHTHAGPATIMLRACGNPDSTYINWLIETAAQSIIEASQRLETAELFWTTAESDLGQYRREYVRKTQNEERLPEETTIKILIVKRLLSPSIVVWSYPCHGTVMGQDNVCVSAEWMGIASQTIEETTGSTAIFLQGCDGDINPRERGGYEVVEYTGRKVGRAIISALSNTEKCDGGIASSTISAELPLLPPPPEDKLYNIYQESHKKLNLEMLKGVSGDKAVVDCIKCDLEWIDAVRKANQTGEINKTIEIEIQAFKIGDAFIVGLPGEPFVEIGWQISKGCDRVITAGYTNGNIGYMPTAYAYEEGGYEVDWAYRLYGLQMIDLESERIIVESARKALENCGCVFIE